MSIALFLGAMHDTVPWGVQRGTSGGPTCHIDNLVPKDVADTPLFASILSTWDETQVGGTLRIKLYKIFGPYVKFAIRKTMKSVKEAQTHIGDLDDADRGRVLLRVFYEVQRTGDPELMVDDRGDAITAAYTYRLDQLPALKKAYLDSSTLIPLVIKLNNQAQILQATQPEIRVEIPPWNVGDVLSRAVTDPRPMLSASTSFSTDDQTSGRSTPNTFGHQSQELSNPWRIGSGSASSGAENHELEEWGSRDREDDDIPYYGA